MRVVLIDPPTSSSQIYGDWDLSALDTYCPPLGLLYIAGYIREKGHDPVIFDVTARHWSQQAIIERTLDTDPDIVGISAKTINVHNAASIAAGIKEMGFGGPIVLGGAHITAVPEETLLRFPHFDFGVIGEGEETFLELISVFENGRKVQDVPGIVYRDELGNILRSPPRPFLQDLDVLPLPAWDLLPQFPNGYPHNALETKRLPAASVITSRGCPFQCTFCDRGVFGKKVRQHSAEYTLNMIRHLRETYGVRDLMFLDDNFILDKRKLFTVCDTMVEENMDVTWYCMGHTKFMTEDRLLKIREAGCWFIEVGIESGSDRILKLIKKNTTREEIAEAVGRARKVGLKVKGNFIFGFPSETMESLEETIHFASNIGLSYFQQNFLTLWPGCELAIEAEKYGTAVTDWDKMAHQSVTFVPHELSEQELIIASKKAFRRFYLRPRIIVEFFLYSLSSWRTMRNAITALIVFVTTIGRKEKQ